MTTRQRGRLRRLMVSVVLSLLLALPAASAAQTRYVRLEGRVPWIAGTVLSLSVDDGPAGGIDVVRAPQRDYSVLAQGDWDLVNGQLTDDGLGVLGSSDRRSVPGVHD